MKLKVLPSQEIRRIKYGGQNALPGPFGQEHPPFRCSCLAFVLTFPLACRVALKTGTSACLLSLSFIFPVRQVFLSVAWSYSTSLFMVRCTLYLDSCSSCCSSSSSSSSSYSSPLLHFPSSSSSQMSPIRWMVEVLGR